jgi:PTS system nitrogen regulatory IIA component
MELDITDLAKRLGLPTGTLDRWIRQGRIPVHRQNDRCVFKEAALEQWARKHNLRFSTPQQKESRTAPDEAVPESLLQVMQRGGIFYDISASDADAALAAAVEQIPDLSDTDRAALLEGLREREAMASTGIGSGVAIPHPRTPLAEPIDPPRIFTCFLQKPVDFSAVDDRPVFVLFVMLSPTIKIHLHLLSRLSFCVRDAGFVAFLREQPDPDALFSRIAEFEQALEAAEP